jgi:hypothetical protein
MLYTPCMSKFWIFICAVLDRWAVLVTGGMVTAVLAVLQAWLQKPISWRFYRWVFMVFVAAACFLAWREEYDRAQRLVEEKAVLQRQLGSPNIIIESPQEFTHRTENIMYVEFNTFAKMHEVERASGVALW